MRVVYKYPLAPTQNPVDLVLPGLSPEVVHVGFDPAGEGFWPTVWIEMDEPFDGYRRPVMTVLVVGTEMTFGNNPRLTHVGSCVTQGGLVWHVYARWKMIQLEGR